MRIGIPKVENLSNELEISALINSEKLGIKDFKLWYRLPLEMSSLISLSSNSFATSIFLLSLAIGEDLEVEGEMSLKLKQNMEQIIKLFSSWRNTKTWIMKPTNIHIKSEVNESNSITPQGIGLFFTLGVDSFHTLEDSENKHQPGVNPISHLIFISGFDIPNSKQGLINQTRENINMVAKSLNKKVLFVSTNLREISDPILNWESEHGAAIASVGQMFAKILSKVFISSSDANVTNSPYGTHPDLDKLWSTETLEFVTYAPRVERYDKMSVIVKSMLAKQYLRVCWENKENKYNCCNCDKCLRTMLQIMTHGNLKEFITFDSEIPLNILDSIIEPVHRFNTWKRIVKGLSDSEENIEIKLKILNMLKRSEANLTTII